MTDPTNQDRQEYLKKLGLERQDSVLPPDERKDDRRKDDQGPPPPGSERRQADRRKTRSVVGRERYLDMVLKERVLFSQQGFSRTAEQLLSATGAGSEQEFKPGERDSATGDQLRA